MGLPLTKDAELPVLDGLEADAGTRASRQAGAGPGGQCSAEGASLVAEWDRHLDNQETAFDMLHQAEAERCPTPQR